MKPRRALLGVDDKTGLVDFAACLARHGVELIATGGTGRALREAGLAVTPVSQVTGVEEMLEGRVKTLHPAIHAGLLARRDRPQDLEQLSRHGFQPIDMVVVNLYPFAATVAAGAAEEQSLEAIDIGGPTLLRAAAKNWRWVAAVSSPDQYPELAAALDGDGIPPSQLRELAQRVFETTSAYDALIAGFLSPGDAQSSSQWPSRLALSGRLREPLRYGENPHQRGAVYLTGERPQGLAAARQLQGPGLSFTNWLDADSAFGLSRQLGQPAAVVVKHTNPCGVALAPTLVEAFRRARDCDPRSTYGGVVGLNRPLDEDTAKALSKHFLELVVAPSILPEAAQVLAGRERLRVLVADSEPGPAGVDVRVLDGGLLVQETDRGEDPESDFEVVSARPPSPAEWEQLRLAWTVARWVKSNAIVLCREQMAVGVGAGQMSRVESVQLAVSRAGERARGSCLASDGFFPMADGLEEAAAAGVTAAIQPGGSKRDQEVVAVADRAGMALVATGRRHFRH